MSSNTQNQTDVHYHETKGTAPVHATSELLDLFAEELPAQHDLLTYGTFGCAFCYGSTASTFSTIATI